MAKNQQINVAKVSRELALDAYLPYKGYTKAVSTSATLAATLGEALPDDIVAVTVVNYNTTLPMTVQFTGDDADATSFTIPAGSGMTIPGDAEALAKLRVFAASEVSAGFITYLLDK